MDFVCQFYLSVRGCVWVNVNEKSVSGRGVLGFNVLCVCVCVFFGGSFHETMFGVDSNDLMCLLAVIRVLHHIVKA